MIKDRLKRSVDLLPTLLTMGNIFCGVFAIVASFNRDWYQACFAIAVAFALDGLDGRIARLVDSQSEFGLQLDALADLVSFGMAPAMIAYTNWMFVYERLGILLAFLFVCGAALRLARFNAHDVESDLKGFFNGFPTPAAAGVVVSLYFLEYKFFIVDQYFLEHYKQAFDFGVPLIVLILSYLMLSNMKFPNFKQATDFDGHPFGVILVLLLFIFLAALFPFIVFSVGFLGYLLLGILNFVPALNWGAKGEGPQSET